jgi:cytoskeletal protein CcmA (bactofilin family)
MRRAHRARSATTRLLVPITLVSWILAACPAPAGAVAFRAGDRVVIPADTTIDDDLCVAGGRVEILGTITGDLMVACRDLVVSGEVGGSVMAAGRALRFPGRVAGSVRAAGESVRLEGGVGRDVLAAGREIHLAPGARIGRDVAGAAAQVRLDGPVARDAWLAGDEVAIADSVGGTVRVDARTLMLEGGAVIGGDLTYTTDGGLVRAPSAQVGGRIEVAPDEAGAPRRRTGLVRAMDAAVDWVQGLVGLFALGLVIRLGFRQYAARALESLRRSPGPCLGLGVLVFVATPAAAVTVFVVGLFVGGWWLALLGAAAYALALLLGYTCSAAHVGGGLLRRVGRGPSAVGALLLGLVVVGSVVKLPFVGWIIGLTAMLFGSGALVRALRAPAPAVASEGNG